jgi:enoyl-CoA hydratase
VPVHYGTRKRSDAPNVVLITLDRPEAKNACDLEHFHQLAQAWSASPP